jgi:hypothetical protein
MLPVVALTLMAACTSHPKVQSDYDGDRDFGQYRTFDFSSRTEIENPDLAGNLELYFSAAVMRELHAKGLVRSDDPDILINVSVDIEDVSRPPVRGLNCPEYEDDNNRRSADSFSGEGRRPMCIYAEGSVAVDLMDVARDQAIIEGVSQVRLGENDRGAALLQSVVNDVATMFGESPVRYRAGRWQSGNLRSLPQLPKVAPRGVAARGVVD